MRLVATINWLVVWRGWIIIQSGITLALLLLSCGRVAAMPARRLGQLDHKSLIMLLLSYAFVLTTDVSEIHRRILVGEQFRVSSLVLFFGITFADAALLMFMRRGYGIQ
jgi:hypothetical protein